VDKSNIGLFADNEFVDGYKIDAGVEKSGLVCFKFGVRVC
jgi:hypothetical protein